jgi:diphthamide biosynthesis enzyme Dph1/Dph2-like protein
MSDVLYIDARRRFDEWSIDFSALDDLPEGDVSLAATVQYLDLIELVAEYLEEKGRKVKVKRGAFYVGHVLGCNVSAYDKKADVFLLLCDGKFHAMNNAILMDREVYVFNSKSLEKVKRGDIDEFKRKLEGKKKKFLISDRVGLLVSVKWGQNFRAVSAVKEKMEAMGKKVYVFEADNIGVGEFENFQDIGIFVNTACFGLARDDNKIINLQDVLEYIK